MEMLNRAIEDASDFEGMKRKLLETNRRMVDAMQGDDTCKEAVAAGPDPLAKLPGENRAQYRARIHGKKAGQP